MPTKTKIYDLYDNGDTFMTLQLDCWPDELNPAQLAAYENAEKEHNNIRSKLDEIVSSSGGEKLYLGEIFSAYQIPAATIPGLETISKPVGTVRKENRARQLAEEKRIKADREAARKREQKLQQSKKTYEDEIEPVDDEEDEDYMPLSKRKAKAAIAEKKKEPEKKYTPTKSKGQTGPAVVPSTFRPTENTSIGGLSVGNLLKKKEVVDLTKDDVPVVKDKVTADSREITFNKLQGKTFPSLVVVARPSLKVKDNINDRPALDAKVKGVLMHTATKYTEWLIQQGLVRSEQGCQIHHGTNLKLGMYSDASKFPYSGGYVWISECCPTRFVSVFSGSLFEGATHPPSVILKLIYHWSCQTNVQNVVQWVKVDNLYVKGLYTWLRSVCTVALYQHMNLLGGQGKKIEVGVISLGTTSQDGQQRQVKVEVLGVLDYENKIVRLRAVEPLSDGERNYKKRFSKILEPLSSWVNKDSCILTDLTVDKGTLQTMGYKHVIQTTTTDGKGKNCNANIMDYLRRIVPRMFQNTLSLLSRQIIQQFLDELVWREWYGTTPGIAFDNIVAHISEQTRLDAKESLVSRLNKVAANPFKNWSHLAVKTPAKTLRDDFFKPSKSTASAASSSSSPASSSTSKQRGGARNKKREPSPEYQPKKKIKEEPKSEPAPSKRKQQVKSYQHDDYVPEPEVVYVFLEPYYYAILGQSETNDSGAAVTFNVQCLLCYEYFETNTALMNHLKQHAKPTDDTSLQCAYCLENWADQDKLDRHHKTAHPVSTKNSAASGFDCIICETRFGTSATLTNHMQKTHVMSELPYRCGCCNYASSSLRVTIDHFYVSHADAGALQCNFCLQIFTVVDKDGSIISANESEYLNHLKAHLEPGVSKKCHRCALSFLTKGSLKVHQLYAHTSQKNKTIEKFDSSTKIAKPKSKSISGPKDQITYLSKYHNVKMYVGNGNMCLECDADFEEDSHITGQMRCQKCKYETCCLRTMLEHTSGCTGVLKLDISAVSPLDCEMHCICGFSSSEGNALARHLQTCDRRTAYPSVEAVQENTVKRNMLDMLGLVRNDDGDESDDLLQPADGVDHGTVVEGDGGAGAATTAANTSTDEPMDTNDQFNTQLSLDDLAPPSVAPQPETDRTPQLRDEYQSLATPRVAPVVENNEFDAMPQSEITIPQSAFDSL